MSKNVHRFIHELNFADLPSGVVEQASRCVLDLVGVAAAGSATELSRIVRDHAANNFLGAGGHARLWFDGRAVSPAGAALANASTIDAMDGHDGHRLTKGHAGVAVLPAAVAALEGSASATKGDLLTALVVGYEIATRAGIALHDAAGDYHSSGTWNALGSAAVAARGFGLGRTATEHTLGIAEYHAPRAPMMRCIDHPTMIKDSSGWGAQAGVSAALLAAEGFTGAPAELLADGSGSAEWDDLGDRWMVLEQYFKPHSVCRWSHPAIEATIDLVRRHSVEPGEIRLIEVGTFAAAARLATRIPRTTEHAQYSLPFPVAVAAVHRAVPPRVIAYPHLVDAQVHRLVEGMRVHESPAMTAVFPARREAEVTLVLNDGRRISSGPTTAIGDPDRPLSTAALVEKFRDGVGPVVGEDRAELLLARLRTDEACLLNELVDEMCRPG